MTGSLRRWICGKGGRRLDLGYNLGIDVVMIAMAGVEHEVGRVGLGEMTLAAGVWDGRLLEEECLVPHDVIVDVCVGPDRTKGNRGKRFGA
jgi:hypothetical protein